MRSTSPNTILQERDRHLLRELAVMRVIDRAQARIAGGFGSDSRTNRRLAKLTHAGFLRRFYLGRNGVGASALYSLTHLGAYTVDVELRSPRRMRDEVLLADFFIHHQLAINTLYLHFKYRPLPESVTFKRWMTFRRPLTVSTPLIPDGYVELATQETIGWFLEIDLGSEHLRIWHKKAEQYIRLALTKDFNRLFHLERFRVLVVANSERRMMSLRKTVAEVTSKLFWFTTIDEVLREGIFAVRWYRPIGENREVLVP
jgi:hypothetical protein